MNFFKRRRFLKNANLLELTPVRIHQYETSEEGKIILLVPKFKNQEVGRFMLGHRATHFRIKLDAIGSEVWQLIDGNSTVGEILDRLMAISLNEWWKQPELDERLSKFMSQLYDNRYISFKELVDNK